MANHSNGMNRRTHSIYLSQEAREAFSNLYKSGIKVNLLIENFILKTFKKQQIKDK